METVASNCKTNVDTTNTPPTHLKKLFKSSKDLREHNPQTLDAGIRGRKNPYPKIKYKSLESIALSGTKTYLSYNLQYYRVPGYSHNFLRHSFPSADKINLNELHFI